MRVIIPESSRRSNDQLESDSIISKRHTDCLVCRLASGFGVIGIDRVDLKHKNTMIPNHDAPTLRLRLNEWKNGMFAQHWSLLNSARQAKNCLSINKTHTKYFLSLTKRNIKRLADILTGGYIYSQAKHRPLGVGRNLIISTALVTAYIGVARLTQIYPFDKK